MPAARTAIEATGRRALALACDVTDSTALRAAIEQVAAEFGRLDVLVSDAGGVSAGSFLTMPDASMRRHIDINLVSALVNFTRTLALELAEHRVRVNCIAPDHAITAGLRGNLRGPVDPSTWADSDDSWRTWPSSGWLRDGAGGWTLNP